MPERLTTREEQPAGSHGKRLSILERSVAQLTEVTVQTARNVDKLEGAVERLSKSIAESGRPQWQTYIAFGVLLLGFVAAVGNPYATRQDKNETEINGQERRIDELERTSAVVTTAQKFLRDRVGMSEERLHTLEIEGEHHHALRERMDATLQRHEAILQRDPR